MESLPETKAFGERPRRGLVMVIIGKGKTTSDLGRALRAIGRGYEVILR